MKQRQRQKFSDTVNMHMHSGKKQSSHLGSREHGCKSRNERQCVILDIPYYVQNATE